MPGSTDALNILAPMLRVRPELQDFCRFGGSWRSVHAPEDQGWAAFHVVTKGACTIERMGQPAVRLEAGDVLLLPHGDGHVVYGDGERGSYRDVAVTFRDYIRVQRTQGATIETELVCGRLHLESASENLFLRTLPPAIVLRRSGAPHSEALVSAIRDELEADRAGAIVIARDLASALFVMLLRQHVEAHPPARGLLALLSARGTARAAAAILGDPARNWGLDELASVAAVSRATLIRSFRRISGLPPQAFLSEVRLEIARNRIRHTSAALGRIAGEVGYQSESAFSRAFQRRFGMRPGAMRRTEGPSEASSPSA